MKKRLSAFVVFICFSLASCHRQNVINDKADYIAGLECRAVMLRERRFVLANELRFAQDTLLQKKGSSDTTGLVKKIESFKEEKERLLQESLQLADTIHLALDSLRKFTFTDNDDKQLFDLKLKEALRKRGCDKN